MAGNAFIGQSKEIILDTKRNIFGLSDVVATLRHGSTSPSAITVNLSEIIEDITSPETLTLTTGVAKYDQTSVVSDVTNIEPLMVFYFVSSDGLTSQYNMVTKVDTGSNIITWKLRFESDYTTDTTITQVGNTGYYKGTWVVQTDNFGDNLSVGDTVLVDVSSKDGGFNFEGQTIVIVTNAQANYDDVKQRLINITDLLDELTGGSSYIDVSRILV